MLINDEMLNVHNMLMLSVISIIYLTTV